MHLKGYVETFNLTTIYYKYICIYSVINVPKTLILLIFYWINVHCPKRCHISRLEINISLAIYFSNWLFSAFMTNNYRY